MKKIFVLILIMTCGLPTLQAQSDLVNLDSLVDEIQLMVGENWFIKRTENGFSATYCRSCAENFDNHFTRLNFMERPEEREEFFAEKLIDSVSYFTTVGQLPVSENWSDKKRHQYFTKLYEANDILTFDVTFGTKWSQPKFDSILNNNNLLRDKILKEPIYKTSMDVFSDYRFWVPDGGTNWKSRTREFDFYFERLPYSSSTIDASIFIEHNKPYFFNKLMLVDKSDREYYFNHKNLLETERIRTLKIIALVLGIHDYHVVN